VAHFLALLLLDRLLARQTVRLRRRPVAGSARPLASGRLLLTGTLRKALTIELLRMRYFPSFTDESAYITTKKANSRVMKSAYDTSQRS
jgi:hypothetical protein